jgi:hypothetical protein
VSTLCPGSLAANARFVRIVRAEDDEGGRQGWLPRRLSINGEGQARTTALLLTHVPRGQPEDTTIAAKTKLKNELIRS